MIRVAHVVVAGELGGAEHMLRDLASASPAQSSIAPVVCVLSPLTEMPRFFEDAGIKVRSGGVVGDDALSTLRRSLGRSAKAWLVDVLRSERADIVHLHTFGSQVLGTRAARAVGAKIVRTEHSTRVYDDPSCWPFSRWSLQRVDRVVAISQHVREVALGRAPFVAERLSVVPNGVDTRHFGAVDRSASSEAQPFTFVLVGRLEPRKGVDRALRALAKVADARLEVVGDGAELGSLKALAETLGIASRVAFHGFLADPRPVLGRADAALASSRKEGLGIAFLEAMATGLPLVTVPVGGLPEIVRDGETGLVASSENVDALASAMNELARPDSTARARARALGAAARNDVVARYSVDAMRAGYGEVYSKLSGG